MDPEEKIGFGECKSAQNREIKEARRRTNVATTIWQTLDEKERRCRSTSKRAQRGKRWGNFPPEVRAAIIARQAKETKQVAALAKANADNKWLRGDVASARHELYDMKKACVPRQCRTPRESILDCTADARTSAVCLLHARAGAQTSLQESCDADFELRIAKERAVAKERSLKSQVVSTERANKEVYAADRVTQRAFFRTYQYADSVQEQAGELCSVAGDAAQEVMTAAKSLPPSKRAALENMRSLARAPSDSAALATAVIASRSAKGPLLPSSLQARRKTSARG